MAQEFAIAAPGTEEMMETGAGLAGAGIAGVLEGVAINMSAQLGALETPFTWATLLGLPLLGVAGALFTKGIVGNLLQGVAAGGTAIAAYVLPAMLIPEGLFGKKGNLTAEQRAIAAAKVKLLTEGPGAAARRAQMAGAKIGIDF